MKMHRPETEDETWTFHLPTTAEERWNAAVERQQLAVQIGRLGQPPVEETLQRIEQRLDEICELWRNAENKETFCSAVVN